MSWLGKEGTNRALQYPPLTTASFTIPITDKSQSFRISCHTLLNESNNYSELKVSLFLLRLFYCCLLQQYPNMLYIEPLLYDTLVKITIFLQSTI